MKSFLSCKAAVLSCGLIAEAESFRVPNQRFMSSLCNLSVRFECFLTRYLRFFFFKLHRNSESTCLFASIIRATQNVHCNVFFEPQEAQNHRIYTVFAFGNQKQWFFTVFLTLCCQKRRYLRALDQSTSTRRVGN